MPTSAEVDLAYLSALMLEAGYARMTLGELQKADVIFTGVALLRADLALPLLGRGLVAQRLGRARDALQLFRQAKGREPGSALVRFHLAEGLLALRQEREGRKELLEAERIDADGVIARAARKRLEMLNTP